MWHICQRSKVFGCMFLSVETMTSIVTDLVCCAVKVQMQTLEVQTDGE